MANKSYLFLLTLFSFLILQASSSKFTSNLLGSKKGDEVKGLNGVKQFFIKYGYLNPTIVSSHDNDHEGSGIIDQYVEEAIKKFQDFYHLNVSGVLDENTLSLMAKPRCGCPDLVNGTIVTHGRLGQSKYVTTTKWSKLNLMWAIKPGTRSDAYKPIYSALRQWALNTKFNFIQSNKFSLADIRIGFFRLNHGDSGIFDGKGGVYGHAGSPPDGGVHFDADETWVNGKVPTGLDIETVAQHELGHSLGLGHSNDKNAIMYAYGSYGEIKRISADDVAGIKALYNFP